jgi:competence protein ComEA
MSDQQTVDINTATADELDAIPALKGHGFEIVQYRDARDGSTNLRQVGEARRYPTIDA